jgi:YHS domain-containing protein
MGKVFRIAAAALGAVVLVVGALAAVTFLRERGPVNAGTDGVMLGGFDPVSYFPEGGGMPRRGDPRFAAARDGRVYRFASDENRVRFEATPGRYEPEFGGWCAYAVANGYKFEVDPESYLVDGGRLFVFYRGMLGDARAEFEKEGRARGIEQADANWPSLR